MTSETCYANRSLIQWNIAIQETCLIAIINPYLLNVKYLLDIVFYVTKIRVLKVWRLIMKKKNISELCLADLLKEKKKNLTKQAELKQASAELDKEIASRPEIQKHIKKLSNTGGSTRVPLNNVIPLDIRLQYRVTRSWDQEFLSKVKKDIPKNLFPFKTQFVEDTAMSKKIEEENQDVFEKIQEGLQTKINERPYISFIDPLKGSKK